jgi:hypothetical protein
MIATLRFKLPEERGDFEDAQSGPRLRLALFEFDQYLRGIAKHGDDANAQQHRDKLHEIMRDNKVSL